MQSPINALLLRRDALEAVRARFGTKAFEWGTADCWQMVRFHLRQLGRRPPAVRPYRSALGAKRSLRARGFESLEAMLDSFLLRIPPAAMLPGDIAAVKGTEGLDALVISAGQKVFGFHEEADFPVFIVPKAGAFDAAWRALP